MAKIARQNPISGEVVWKNEEVQAGIDGLAPNFYELFQGSYVHRNGRDFPPVVMTMMNGGEPFANALVTATQRQFPDFNPPRAHIRWSMYAQETPDGVKRLPKLIEDTISELVYGRTVINADDILETGDTSEANENHLYQKHGAACVKNVYLIERLDEARKMKAALSVFKTMRRAWFIGWGMNDDALPDDPLWGKAFPDGGRSLTDIIVSPNSPHKF